LIHVLVSFDVELFHLDGKQKNDQLSATTLAALSQYHDRAARSWIDDARRGETPSLLSRLRFTKPPLQAEHVIRSLCPSCSHSSSIYCPYCRIPCQSHLLPRVRLPVRLTIVHHHSDHIKKSTSIHACVVSPEDTEFLEASEPLPEFDVDHTLLLFPSKHALPLDSEEMRLLLNNVDRLVVIESTWQKASSVAARPELNRLIHCCLPDTQTESLFWRYQEIGAHAVSTIEACHKAMMAIEQARSNLDGRGKTHGLCSQGFPLSSSDNSLDDLLFIFAYQHSQLRNRFFSSSSDTDEAQLMRRPKAWSTSKLNT